MIRSDEVPGLACEFCAAMKGCDIVDIRVGKAACGTWRQTPPLPPSGLNKLLCLWKCVADRIAHPLRGPARHLEGLADVVEGQTISAALHLHGQPYQICQSAITHWRPSISRRVTETRHGFKLSRSGNKTTVEKVWSNPKVRLHFANAIRIGDVIYGSSGDFGSR